MSNLNTVQWSETFVGRFERFARPARYLYFRLSWRWKKTSTVDREYSKTKKNHQTLITKRIRKAPYLAQYTIIGKVIKRFRTAGLYWPWSMTVCPKIFWACFFHHSESVYKVGRNTEQDVFRISCQKISVPRKSQEGWPLTFWPKVLHVAPAFHLLLEYEVRSLEIENIHSHCTRNNGLFMSHNDLDLQTGDLKLYECLPVVL